MDRQESFTEGAFSSEPISSRKRASLFPRLRGSGRAFFNPKQLCKGSLCGRKRRKRAIYAMYLAAWSDVIWPIELPLLDKSTTRSIQIFRNSLRVVRRVLANNPTYMIFDDHEVTDDWYLNRRWRDNIHKSALGLRILQNALSAYAVFQGWGNDPAQYETNRPGGKLLEQLANWTGEDDETAVSIRKQLNLRRPITNRCGQMIQGDIRS